MTTAIAIGLGGCPVCDDESVPDGTTGERWLEADELFRRGDPRWLGGDGAYSVDLGGERTLWLFGDSFIATSPAHTRSESTIVRNSIAVINAVRPRSGKVDLKKVVDHFNRRCRAVLEVPFDPHLEEGAEISLERLKPDTRQALLELAATVASGFPGARR